MKNCVDIYFNEVYLNIIVMFCHDAAKILYLVEIVTAAESVMNFLLVILK